MNVYDIIKINLKTLRTDNSMTQQELSDKIGIPRANLARYETGENIPPLDIILKYANFFEISLDELFGRNIN